MTGGRSPPEKTLYFHIKYTKCFEIKNMLWRGYLKIFFKTSSLEGGILRHFYKTPSLEGGILRRGGFLVKRTDSIVEKLEH